MPLNLPIDNEQPWGVKLRAALNDLDARPSLTDGAVTNAKVAAAAGISADKLVDGTTNKLLTATERSKLGGVAPGATVNATDAQLRDRTTHVGSQLSLTISDFTEAVQDAVAALLVAGANVTVAYNDTANTLTIAAAGGTGGAVDATTTAKGVVQLAGDLAGTAAAPTVPGLDAKADLTALASSPMIVQHTGTNPLRPATTRPVIWVVPDANRPSISGTTAGGSYGAVDGLDVIWTF